MTDFEAKYVFCKDAKASTANVSSWSSALFSGSNSSFPFKATYSNQSVWAHTLKVAILTSYKNVYVGYFELKLYIHTLGTS